MRHPRWARRFLSEADFDAIARAIVDAEARTSAEIRVHLERRVHRKRWGGAQDALHRARAAFTDLGMRRTAARNGVLIYLAIEDRKLAIVGDEGIHGRVGHGYWSGVRDVMVERLQAGASCDAILAGIAEIGRVLAEYFPRRPGDANELGDQVSVE